MKVLTVISCFNNGYGGVQKTAQILAKSFKENNYESKLLITAEDELENNNLLKTFFKNIYAYKTIQREDIAEWEPNIIIFIDHSIRFNDVKFLFGINNTWKICFSIWGNPSEISENSDHLLLLSPWSKMLYENLGGINKKISIIGIPFDLDNILNIFDEKKNTNYLSKKSKKDNLITLGRIGQPAEGSWSPLIVDIFEELYEYYPDIELLLIGASQETIKRAKKSKISSKIIIKSAIKERKEIFKIHESIDIFIHISSFGETFGKVILESLFTGAYVVVLNTPWASIGHKFYKFQDDNLLHVNNIKNFRRILQNLVQIINLKRSKRELKIKYIEPYSGEKTVKKIINIYKKRNCKFISKKSNKFEIIKSLDRSYDKLNLLSRLHIIIFGLRFRYLHRLYCGYTDIIKILKKLIKNR